MTDYANLLLSQQFLSYAANLLLEPLFYCFCDRSAEADGGGCSGDVPISTELFEVFRYASPGRATRRATSWALFCLASNVAYSTASIEDSDPSTAISILEIFVLIYDNHLVPLI